MLDFKPHTYQQYAIDKIIKMPAVGLFLDMGLGKTVCTLTAINDLMFDSFKIARVLLIAPKKVAESTWDSELEKWSHTKNIRISKVLGTEQQRIKALSVEADIYIINRENVTWLVKYYSRKIPFDMLVIDESSSFKSHTAKRFKALKLILPFFEKVVLLTGTPASNSLMDLWAQIYLIDRGVRLGKTITAYRQEYFVPDKQNGHIVYSYKLKPEAKDKIYQRIGDVTFSMTSADWLDMPECIYNNYYVELDNISKKLYKELEKELVLSLPDGDITANNAAALSNKLLQLSNGAIYDENNKVRQIHQAKLEALSEIVESSNKALLVFYNYKHDRARILNTFKFAKTLDNDEDIKAWNAGKIKMLITHPQSAGYGLNLQAGGNIIIWFGLTWSLEQYQQANARLYRQGQKQKVIIHHLIAKSTIDEKVIVSLQNKDVSQKSLIDAVKARIEEYKKGG